MAFERSSSADTADFTEGKQKYDCWCNEFSKVLYKNKYTKMNCWRNVADKFDTSPEDAEKIVKGIHLFFSQRSQRSYGNRLIVEIIGIARIAELIFQRFWRSQRLYGNRLAHQMLLVQLSSGKIQLLVLSLQLISQLF